MRLRPTLRARTAARPSTLGLPALVAALTTACATSPPPAQRPTLLRTPGGIARAELVRSCPSTRLLECLEVVRPTFLSSRGRPVQVILDGVLLAEVGTGILSAIPTRDVEDVRLLNSRDANNRYGVGGGMAVIEVRTRRGGPGRS